MFILRVAVALTLMASTVYRSDSNFLFIAGAVLVSLALTIGCLTPLMSGIAGAFSIANALFFHQTDALILALAILDAAALALLGPGAYSLDSKLYGRTVTIVPPRKDPDKF